MSSPPETERPYYTTKRLAKPVYSRGGACPPLRYRFFGEKAPRPRRGGGGDGLGGDPCGRPSSFHREGRGRPQGSPLHHPTSPAPTGTKPLSMPVCKKPIPERAGVRPPITCPPDRVRVGVASSCAQQRRSESPAAPRKNHM